MCANTATFYAVWTKRWLCVHKQVPSCTEWPLHMQQVRSVASAPGDPFARFALSVADPEVTARFYCEVLGMQEVFRSDQEVCVRYAPQPPEDATQRRNKKLRLRHAKHAAAHLRTPRPH